MLTSAASKGLVAVSVAKSTVVRSFASAVSSFGENIKFDVEKEIAIITLDTPNSKVNVLSKGLMEDFTKALDYLEKSSGIRAAVLMSSKPDGFIAGADINMLSACKTSQELEELSRNGQKIMDRIENSRIPIVAAIHGSCLGGGLEVALACHSRVASSSSKTVLGLPEVMLGLLPGAGGTQRLPKLIGAAKALDIVLTGKNIRADRAKSMKLVDVVADPAALKTAAVLVASQLADGTMKKYERKPGIMDYVLQKNRFGIDFMIKKATETVMKTTKGKYPAPLAILDVVKEGLKNGTAAGLAKEATEFSRLGMTPESKSLVSLFFGQTALKKNRFGKPQKEYKRIAMIGAGLMGAGIAQVSIEKDIHVVLKDQNSAGLARGEQQIYNNLNQKVKKSMTGVQRDIVLSRLTGITAEDSFGNKHLKNVSMVIEAVFEDLKVKHKVIQDLEKVIPEDCIIASNTSAIPIGKIAEGSRHPENVIGMHYFSPVDKMPLLEVVTHDKASNEAKSAAVEVGIKQGKTVIVVRDGPGFYTTRVLSPFMVEAGGLLQEGHGIKELDKIIRDFGFPVGPVTLFDEVGIDVGNHIQPTLIAAFGERMGGAKTEMMQEMVQNKFCGRKTKAGFFLYEGKNKEINPKAEEIIKKYQVGSGKSNLSPEEIQNRVVLRMINESVYCLQDQTLESPLDGDMGAVFGLGFPPFLGGPFRYIDRVGPQKIVDLLRGLTDKFGKRFEPAPLLVDLAKQNKKFHPN